LKELIFLKVSDIASIASIPRGISMARNMSNYRRTIEKLLKSAPKLKSECDNLSFGLLSPYEEFGKISPKNREYTTNFFLCLQTLHNRKRLIGSPLKQKKT
jgi:hypothetical protein